MSGPIQSDEITTIQILYTGGIAKPSTHNLGLKVLSLKYARRLLETKQGKSFDSVMVASFSYLDQYLGPRGAANLAQEGAMGAVSNYLRQTARLLFPTPQDFAEFMKLSTTVEKTGDGLDELARFGQVALIYINAFAETWNTSSVERAQNPEEAPSWKRFATDMDIHTVFGSKYTPQMSLSKPTVDPQVDLALVWVGTVIDMAVRLERWDGTSTCAHRDVYALSQWLGMR